MRKLLVGLSLFGFLCTTIAISHAQATPAADASTATADNPPPPQAPKYPPSQAFINQEGRFSAIFAGTPKKDSSVVPLAGGESTTINSFTVTLDDSNDSYTLIYNDYPADYANGDPQAVLTSLRDGSITGKTLLSDNPITLGGVPGRAFTSIDGHGWIFTVHQFLKGKRLYQLIVVGTAYHPAYLSDQFLSSFKIW
jgi:hypothetical protein